MSDCSCNNFPASLGNVSFGAAAPPTALGRLHVVASTDGVGIHLVGGDKDITWPTSEALQLGTWDGSTFTPRLAIDSSGNVGIATTSPISLLTLGGEAARTIQMERRTALNSAGNALTVRAGGATSGAADKAGGDLCLSSGYATGSGSSGIQFQTAAAGLAGTNDRAPTTKMVILGNGRVGIGTTTPSNLFHVSAASGDVLALVENTIQNGVARLGVKNDAVTWEIQTRGDEDDLFAVRAPGQNPILPLTIATDADDRALGIKVTGLALGGTAAKAIQMDRATADPTPAGNSLTLQAGGAKVAATDKAGGDLILASGIATGAGASGIYLRTAGGGASGTGDSAPATRVAILGDGKVGIGVNPPTETLDVAGTLKTSGIVGVRTAPSSGIALFVKGSRIRLEDDLAGRGLELQSDVGVGVDLKSSGAALYINAGAGAPNTILNPDAGKVAIGGSLTDADSVLRIGGKTRTDGNVGINKAPDATVALDVNGSIRSSGDLDTAAARLSGALAQIHGRSYVGIASNTYDDLLLNFNGAVYFGKGTQGGGSQGGNTQKMKLDTDGSLWLGTTPRKSIDADGYALYG